MTREEAKSYLMAISHILGSMAIEYLTEKDGEKMREAITSLEQESCEDAISRQATIDAMFELCDTGETLKKNPWRDNPHIDAITDAIENLPSATPQPKKSKWIEHSGYNGDDFGKEYSCSECNEWMKEKTKFCPNCGAKMDVNEEDY